AAAEDANGAELFSQRLDLRRATSPHDDPRALLNKKFRGEQTVAAVLAGDHSDFAIQPSHVVLLRCCQPSISPGRPANASRSCHSTISARKFCRLGAPISAPDRALLWIRRWADVM